jgi:hypothetical protein
MLAFGSWGRCSWVTDANATFNMHGSNPIDQINQIFPYLVTIARRPM